MSALMSDVIEGAVTPVVVNAAVNAGGKMLKAVEMQYKYGKPDSAAPGGGLELTPPSAGPAPRNELLQMRERIDRMLGEGGG